jgi:glucose-1-phosphate cytidylyltransferase
MRTPTACCDKPMIPIGDKPILWHLMNFYSEHGHKDFVLCLGYKANTIKEFFLNGRPELYSDGVVTQGGAEIQLLGKPRQDWRITMIDTGMWRNIGERLWAVREQVQHEQMFMANYSDGLAAVNLPEMVETFKRSGKVACFLAVRPSFSLHLVDMTPGRAELSIASHAHSRNCRCCGSMMAASWRPNAKKSASNNSMPSRSAVRAT